VILERASYVAVCRVCARAATPDPLCDVCLGRIAYIVVDLDRADFILHIAVAADYGVTSHSEPTVRWLRWLASEGVTST
jgi:hypothetical protein